MLNRSFPNRTAVVTRLQEAAARARRLAFEFSTDPIAPGLLRYAEEQERRAAGIKRLSLMAGDRFGSDRNGDPQRSAA